MLVKYKTQLDTLIWMQSIRPGLRCPMYSSITERQRHTRALRFACWHLFSTRTRREGQNSRIRRSFWAASLECKHCQVGNWYCRPGDRTPYFLRGKWPWRYKLLSWDRKSWNRYWMADASGELEVPSGQMKQLSWRSDPLIFFVANGQWPRRYKLLSWDRKSFAMNNVLTASWRQKFP
jgi:hypothetical protein